MYVFLVNILTPKSALCKMAIFYFEYDLELWWSDSDISTYSNLVFGMTIYKSNWVFTFGL